MNNVNRFSGTVGNFIFSHRSLVLIVFFLLTFGLGYYATQIKLDASFVKNIPQQHPYMQTYLKHRQNFGGANNILIAVCDERGDIFNAEFFSLLNKVHDQLFFIPGVERTQVKSLFAPSTRFVEVVEDGFTGGPVIPASFKATAEDLAQVKMNIEKSGTVGRLVSEDYRCAMVSTSLMEIDPLTGEKLDELKMAEQLETLIREPFESKSFSINIIGFSKMVGDVAEGAKGVVTFFLITIAVTTLMVLLFFRNLVLAVTPIICSIIAVVWQLGGLSLLGYGLDPMSILVPFLVFAIGVSHGVQMNNAINKQLVAGVEAKEAACRGFNLLLVAGLVALITDTIGFFTLLTIDIGVIRELAIAASLGVAMIILTNLTLLPLLVSFVKSKPKQEVVENNLISPPVPYFYQQKEAFSIWRLMASTTQSFTASLVLIITTLLFVTGFYYANNLKVGDLHEGAPALHKNSRYNLDTKLITEHFTITVDYLTVIAETIPDACTYYEYLHTLEQFQWRMENVKGVESTTSLASITKVLNAGYNEGNLKWQVLPRNQQSLVQSISRIPTSSGLLNKDCSVMPVYIFLADHKEETISLAVAEVKKLMSEFNSDKLTFYLASGPMGVMAATNETVSEAQTPMLLYVFAAVSILCLLSFRSIKATLAVVIPLYVVSILTQWLMTSLAIGLTIYTLPIIALGVGIGVDYGIYILSNMIQGLNAGKSVAQSYEKALEERGSAVLITGITLGIGVATWIFSDLKFQADMGILLTFMFLVNMFAALIILPALASLFWRKNK